MILKLFQEFGQQHWHWEAELLPAQAAHLLSARLRQDNAASLVQTVGEGLSAQDHVRFKPFSVTQKYCLVNTSCSADRLPLPHGTVYALEPFHSDHS